MNDERNLAQQDMAQVPSHRTPEEQVGMLRAIYERAGLTWKLFWDKRVGFAPKLIPLLGVAYLFLPIDLLPEAVLAVIAPLLTPLAMLDDLGVILVTLNWFVQAAPPDIVQEYLREFRRRYLDDDNDNVIDSYAEPLDE